MNDWKALKARAATMKLRIRFSSEPEWPEPRPPDWVDWIIDSDMNEKQLAFVARVLDAREQDGK